MKSRRNFLQQSSFAGMALMVYNPFKSIANTLSPITGFSVNDNKLVLIHTGVHKQHFTATAGQVNYLRKTTGNLMVLHTGKQTDLPANQLNCDVSMDEDLSDKIISREYRIIQKGNIKTGILHVTSGEYNALERINSLSAWLKKERGCKIVVCLSQLGYKTKRGLNDMRLANESSHIDIICSGHPTNYPKAAYVAMNSKSEEVIISTAAGHHIDFGNIELEFDDAGNKKSIAINNLSE